MVKVSTPTGDIGSFPQTTARNPSQVNGGDYQAPRMKVEPSHVAPEVRAELSNLTPELAAGVRRVADTK
jgi:hypothetical protein